MDSSSGDTDSSNFVYNLIDLPSPPQVPPTKIQGVSVEDRVDAYECRSNLLDVLDTMGVSKSHSPLQTNEYPIHPSPRRTVTTRIWKSSPAVSKVESDYETMLPQIEKLNLSQSPTKRRPLPREPDYSDQPSTTTISTESHASQPGKYVIFKDRSKLFMSSSSSKYEEPLYARIDELWSENDRSTDSGFSDRPEVYGNPSTILTSDEVSLISRYQRVLKNRTKKSRFRRLSEYLRCGGSVSDDEDHISEESLYDSLLSSGTSFASLTARSGVHSPSPSEITADSSVFDSPTSSISSPDDTMVRYSKKHFFYTPSKLELASPSGHSEYVLPEQWQKTPTTRLSRDPLSFSSGSSPLKPQRRPPRSVMSPLALSHDYENIRDFTKRRKEKTEQVS